MRPPRRSEGRRCAARGGGRRGRHRRDAGGLHRHHGPDRRGRRAPPGRAGRTGAAGPGPAVDRAVHRGVGHGQPQGDGAAEREGRATRSSSRSTPTAASRSRAPSSPSARPPVRASRCCRPTTRAATSPRWCSASRCGSQYRRRTRRIRSGPACRSTSRSGSGSRQQHGHRRTSPAPASARKRRSTGHRYLIAFAVTLASVLELVDTSIVNVAIPHMMGNLGATLEEIAWVSTGYIVANVIVLPLTQLALRPLRAAELLHRLDHPLHRRLVLLRQRDEASRPSCSGASSRASAAAR